MQAVRPADVMGSLAKGLAVIEVFGPGRERLSITDVARLTGMDRAAARRCLLTLASCGYAEHDGKYFSLTVRVLRLGYAYLSSTSLPQRLQPVLEALSETLQESCSASILDGTEITYIARAAQRRVMSIGLSVGSRLPAYCASMGRVLLASLGDAEAAAILARSDIQRRTPNTMVDRDALLEEIRSVRKQGFSLVDQELELGLRSLAVPVHDRNGRVVAALNTGRHAGGTTCTDLETQFLPHLREASRRLAQIL